MDLYVNYKAPPSFRDPIGAAGNSFNKAYLMTPASISHFLIVFHLLASFPLTRKRYPRIFITGTTSSDQFNSINQ